MKIISVNGAMWLLVKMLLLYDYFEKVLQENRLCTHHLLRGFFLSLQFIIA